MQLRTEANISDTAPFEKKRLSINAANPAKQNHRETPNEPIDDEKQTTLGKFPEKPFHVSVGGNKSTVLPNGIFDVILEAEQTGGVVRTQNGRTRR